MPISQGVEEVYGEVIALNGSLTDVQTALDALPATPVEADLPDIVSVVKALKDITASLTAQTAAFIAAVKTTRINS